MVFSFSEKPVLFSAFFGGQKPERSGVHKPPTLCFGIVKWERVTPKLILKD
jgi:hypothetical protein